MKLRQALKVRDKIVDDSRDYRSRTVQRMRRRLLHSPHSDDIDIYFHRMMNELREGDPIGFAGLQFEAGQRLIEMGLGSAVGRMEVES